MIGPFYGIFCLDDDEPSGSIKKSYPNCLISLIFEIMSRVSDAFECLKYANTGLHKFSKKLGAVLKAWKPHG